MRRKAKQITIDEYVISESDNVYSNFQRYINLLINRYSQVYVTKYEEMVSEFQIWLERLLGYCELEITGELLQSLLEESKQLQPIKENIDQHIRKGKPGDYKEKLEPETINYLNSKFLPVLDKFNYI